MGVWLIWFAVAAVLVTAEIFTLTAVLGLLGAAALLTGGAAALGLPLIGQLLVFATAAIAGLVLLRPIALRHLLRPQLHRLSVVTWTGPGW